MFKGTPGPWRLEDDAFEKDWPGCLNGHIGVNAPSHTLIAQVVWRMSDGDTHRKDYPELQANAHLIAAAPELLEAASMALSVMEVEYITNNRTDLAQFMEPLRAAIAKALGETK